MCVRVDGRDLAEVASACGAAVSRLQTRLCDLEPWLMTPLQSAQAGEVIGPLAAAAGAYVLATVRARRPPRAGDGSLRTRAESALVERAERRATEGRVEWHEHF